jgi:membrane protease YdiL (CAAX protease family)
LLAAGFVLYWFSGLAQELAFRGYFFQGLKEKMPLWLAALVMSLIFAIPHLMDGFSSPLGAIVVVADTVFISLFFLLTRISTNSLWMAIGLHTTLNWTMDYIFSLDTGVAADYGNSLIHVSLNSPNWLIGKAGAVEWLYMVMSFTLFAGYWLFLYRKSSSKA